MISQRSSKTRTFLPFKEPEACATPLIWNTSEHVGTTFFLGPQVRANAPTNQQEWRWQFAMNDFAKLMSSFFLMSQKSIGGGWVQCELKTVCATCFLWTFISHLTGIPITPNLWLKTFFHIVFTSCKSMRLCALWLWLFVIGMAEYKNFLENNSKDSITMANYLLISAASWSFTHVVLAPLRRSSAQTDCPVRPLITFWCQPSFTPRSKFLC